MIVLDTPDLHVRVEVAAPTERVDGAERLCTFAVHVRRAALVFEPTACPEPLVARTRALLEAGATEVSGRHRDDVLRITLQWPTEADPMGAIFVWSGLPDVLSVDAPAPAVVLEDDPRCGEPALFAVREPGPGVYVCDVTITMDPFGRLDADASGCPERLHEQAVQRGIGSHPWCPTHEEGRPRTHVERWRVQAGP